jgi:aspartate racemase
VETCKEKVKEMGLKRCGLIGTKFTMNATFFSDVFVRENIKVISPDENEIQRINNLLFTELERGIFSKNTKAELLGIVQGMIEHHRIDSLILGCTEFPLMFNEDTYLGIPFLNTTRIHVAEIVKQCLAID